MQEQQGPEEAPLQPQEPETTEENPQKTTDPFADMPRKFRPRRGRRLEALLHNRRSAIRAGIIASNGLGLLVMLVTYWFAAHRIGGDIGTVFIASYFVLLPMLMGGVCSYFWQEANLDTQAFFGYHLMNAGVALLLSFLFLHEGVICLLMASPLLVVFMLLGGFIGGAIFKARPSGFNATLIPLALALFVGDSLTPHHFENQETDRIVIHASPQRVWQYIIDYPANNTPSDYWLSRLGLPAPVQSTATEHSVGALRRCLFTGGIAFDEKITVVEPARKLEFDVVTQPNHPEVIGHLILQKGRFLLTDNHDGTTTVEGTSWYQLNVYPVSYYDLWTQDIIRHVHLRVMRHIKALAESKEKDLRQ